MGTKIDIHKAGGILIKDRKFLVGRSKGKAHFVAPGGKLEAGESPEEALIRELHEELGIDVVSTDFENFGTFVASAAGEEHRQVHMDVFIVKYWRGDVRPTGEVEEIAWINSALPDGMKVGSIFQHEVLPRLKREEMID